MSQELAIRAVEGFSRRPPHDENAEHALLHEQGSEHQGENARPQKALWEWKINFADIRLIDQLTADATGQAILADRHARLLVDLETVRQTLTARADSYNADRFRVSRIVQCDTAEIDRQLLFQVTQQDLKNARQILAFADGARNPMQQ